MMRNVGEQVNDHAVDSAKRRYKHLDQRSIQVGNWDGITYQWLGESLNIDVAHDAACKLLSAISTAAEAVS
jgi:hypothetical protein